MTNDSPGSQTTAVRYSPLDMIKRLVAFDTTSRNSNLELIDFVAAYLGDHGVASRLVFNDDKTKANLYATLGPQRPGGVVLSGHTDVVPVDGQDWRTDPFEAVEKDGRLYGRGTADMKSFFAVALALVPRFLSRELAAPVHFALSYDEEVGCLGAPRLVERIVRNVPRPAAVIVGEPTMMKVVNAHKGVSAFRTTVTGREAHSSATDKGVNAVMAAAELVSYISALADEMKAKGDPSGRFDPPYTTLHVGTIEGGTALNIIPKSCSFVWECRALPGENVDALMERFRAFAERDVLPTLRKTADEAAIATDILAQVPSFEPFEDPAAETLALLLAKRNETHAVSYATEAGIFQAAGIPTIVCGPGDILQAHRPDEFVSLDQVEACTAFMHRLLDHVSV